MRSDSNIDIFPLIDRAIGIAAVAHRKQVRKTGDMPYLAHVVGVALILERMGCEDEIIAAGILHDTVEDTDITIEDIRAECGSTVADIVAGCTEPKGLPWEIRKTHAIAAFRDAPIPVKIVAAADKYHNLRHMLKGREKQGDAMWDRFTRPRGQQAWYYRSVWESLTTNLPRDVQARYPIFDMLASAIADLFSGVESYPPAD